MQFSGLGLIEFYDEEHASRAEKQMHCAELGDQTIAVQVYEPKKVIFSDDSFALLCSTRANFEANQGPIAGLHTSAAGWAEAPPFIPSAVNRSFTTNGMNATAPVWTPPISPMPQRSLSGPLPSPTSQYNVSSSGIVIDPTNLFIKNLDSTVTSQDLFTAFKPFGRIVSARVMRDDKTGLSKEFGFVSYQREDEASQALKAMDNTTLTSAQGGSSTVVVRLHEPKRFRETRLQNRFASAGGAFGTAGVDDINARFGTLSTNVLFLLSTLSRERRLMIRVFPEPAQYPASIAPTELFHVIKLFLHRRRPIVFFDVHRRQHRIREGKAPQRRPEG
jgi:polyadenylate-binding protein